MLPLKRGCSPSGWQRMGRQQMSTARFGAFTREDDTISVHSRQYILQRNGIKRQSPPKETSKRASGRKGAPLIRHGSSRSVQIPPETPRCSHTIQGEMLH